ncbi:amidohydrolase [Streptomyces scopuliridis]|uniref:amidohydrolase n=1 Tax=Streptomyces scopuliridis TaxID=452529 RepID=UPI003698FDDB
MGRQKTTQKTTRKTAQKTATAYDAVRTLRNVRLGAGGPVCDVRIEGGRVSEIHPGGTAAAQRGVGVGGPDVDLDGRTLLPGLWDAHVHIVQWAVARRRLDLAGTGSARSVARIARERAASMSPGELLVGYGFRDGLWPDAPHKDLLDAVLPDRPVLLVSADLHSAWLNSAGLALLGRGDHPNGLLREEECLRATAQLSSVTTEMSDAWVREACAAAARRGITGILDFEYADNVTDWTRRMTTGPAATDAAADDMSGLPAPAPIPIPIPALVPVPVAPPIPIPVRVAAAVYPEYLDAAIGRGLRTGVAPREVPGGLLETGPLKLFTDGSLNTRTALCHDPYPGMPSGGPGEYGLAQVTPEELTAVMRRAAAHGIEPAVHAIGDRANGMALDAFEAVRCRGRIEHGQLLRPEDIPRFAPLDITVGVQPTHAVDDRDVADRYWHGRTHRAFPFADLLAAGAALELGSDAPVAPLDPWRSIANAVARTDDARPAWHPEQRLSVAQALASSSRGRRSVRVGDIADLVVVDVDPLTADLAVLRDMPVYGTMLAGAWTHLAD